VLVAPWAAPSAFRESFPIFLRIDPLGIILSWFGWNAGPFVRNPGVAARKLISPQAMMSPQELHARLGSESALVLFQHNPPHWSPPEMIRTPTLLMAAERDTMISVKGLQRTASLFNADFMLAPGAGHNIMMDINSRQSAENIRNWLEKHIMEK
jgi:alpha-beta hydrolase superfamily lysophospholipase